MYDAPPWVECLTEMGGAISIAKPPPIGVVDADEFAESVKAAVAPGDWDKRKGWSLQCNHGVIVVRAPGAVHRAIKRHLEILKTRPR
jgi:hypothetical protein